MPLVGIYGNRANKGNVERRDSEVVLAAKNQHIVACIRRVGFDVTSQYHKSRDFQDNSANLEFFGLI
jgi:hypothetical protein